MAKKSTLAEIGQMLSHVVEHMATKEDLERFAIKEDVARTATKDDVATLGTQIASIENQLREMKYGALQVRVLDLEEKVFGRVRS
jgi:hypothetical protein